MKLNDQLHFQIKSVFALCRSIPRVFKFKKPFFIKTLRFPKHQPELKTSPPRKLSTGLRSLFKSPKRPREMSKLASLKSFQKAPCPSPLTPAYVRRSAAYDHKEEVLVNEACRSFEKQLMEMIVVEGRIEHLGDVEEVLYCWNNLKSPVFMGLVSRFYGELCKDLF